MAGFFATNVVKKSYVLYDLGRSRYLSNKFFERLVKN